MLLMIQSIFFLFSFVIRMDFLTILTWFMYHKINELMFKSPIIKFELLQSRMELQIGLRMLDTHRLGKLRFIS